MEKVRLNLKHSRISIVPNDTKKILKAQDPQILNKCTITSIKGSKSKISLWIAEVQEDHSVGAFRQRRYICIYHYNP